MASLFVNELTVIDFSYLHPTRGIVGESWIVDVILEGDLNDEGMVFDFGLVKKQIKQAIDTSIDHKFVVPMHMPGLTLLQDDEDLIFDFSHQDGFHLSYRSPREAAFLLDSDSLNIDVVVGFMQVHLMSLLPKNVKAVQLNLYPQDIQGAFFHYSHGLKKHQGDCQRICHGHRSPIVVTQDGHRAPAIESAIATLWQDIYLITEEDIIRQSDHDIQLGYDAEQGYFELTLPRKMCYVMQTDTTVELIAEHLLTWVKKHYPASHTQVMAFEGFKKGAIAHD